jgi:hypothetical protein
MRGAALRFVPELSYGKCDIYAHALERDMEPMSGVEPLTY